MIRLNAWRIVALANLALLGTGAVIVACSGDDSSGIDTTTTDSGTRDTSVTPGSDTGTTGNDGSTVQGKPPGCFAGTPTTNLQFLNACTTADYVVFDNCARIGLCDGGSLPALRDPKEAGAPDASVADAADAAVAVDSSVPIDASADATGD